MSSIDLRKTNLPILWLGVGGSGKLEKIRRAAASNSGSADVGGFSFEVKELQMHDDYKARIIIAPSHIEIDVSDFSMVRSGTGFFGLDEGQNKNLTPALSLTSIIVQLKHLPTGVGVGYDRKYITHHKEYVAIIPIGYADFLPLIPNEKIHVTVNGTKRKVLGYESMDQIVIQARKGDKIGDEVRFFGDRNKGFTSPIDFAKPSGTTIFNMITHTGNRVKREYINEL
jgi:alanine racemase